MNDEPDLRPRLLRLAAQMHEVQASALRFRAAKLEAAASCRRLCNAFRSGVNRDVADHPDLAELNVMMDGHYGGTLL
ncbi:hypothetical protein D5S18_24915 [Nocardia panacis]|uniref:Uncharacterized protein n=1 Tax=Nocardia panacis TaxID=2340916 RepID=A0A3A4K997_9NOCA|nr:hypothetical protein [Nocardia panacis]RJO71416.1 hypothetical protein D5S18_24915 [Nocardia panacis]